MTQDTFKTLREFTPAPGKTAKYHSLAALEAAKNADRPSYIACKTTIGFGAPHKAGTSKAHGEPLGADELGRIATQALLTRTGLDPALIDEVIFGCVGQPADAANVARVIALRAGIPEHVPAITVHRNCASGLEALTQAYEKVAAGRGSIFLVGGTESMNSSTRRSR